ncbi:hypothetical protein HZH68_016030 [Vespula germanica]|uniref:Uncharacterized protein n=2 Tax=Vespula TaxID=7451 RepID=A0A834MQN3_VESGE|nr:hypothetical protein HZH68_016030 [Vespula germanica]KAF7392333.1 hypothetical protein H0235_017332 [Vespula pensylvanica]
MADEGYGRRSEVCPGVATTAAAVAASSVSSLPTLVLLVQTVMDTPMPWKLNDSKNQPGNIEMIIWSLGRCICTTPLTGFSRFPDKLWYLLTIWDNRKRQDAVSALRTRMMFFGSIGIGSKKRNVCEKGRKWGKRMESIDDILNADTALSERPQRHDIKTLK